MSYPEGPQNKEIRESPSLCVCGVFWGVVLIAIGVFALLPGSPSRYVWPAVAIGAGAWLLFGQWDWYRKRPRNPYQEPANRI